MPQLKKICHRKNVLSQEETSFQGFVSEWMSNHICEQHIWYPNYRYFERFLSCLTPAVFGWKYWLPRSKTFYPTLVGGVTMILRLSQFNSTSTGLLELSLAIILRNILIAPEQILSLCLPSHGRSAETPAAWKVTILCCTRELGNMINTVTLGQNMLLLDEVSGSLSEVAQNSHILFCDLDF